MLVLVSFSNVCVLAACFGNVVMRPRTRLRRANISDFSEHPLIAEFVKDIGMGNMYPTHVVRYARILRSMGWEDEAVHFFASLGTDNFNNVERDLHTRVRACYGIEPYMLGVSVCVDGGAFEDVEIACIAPYEYFAAMFAAGTETFRKSILGLLGEATLSEYWERAGETAWGKSHPVYTSNALADCWHRVIPTYWHADGVEIYTDQEFHIFSWSSALAWNSNEYDQVHFLTMVAESSLIENVTYNQIVSFIKWNLNVLMSGKHPSKDNLGNEFPPGGLRSQKVGCWLAGSSSADAWRAAFSAWQGDLKEKRICHRFQRHYLCSELCEWCEASRTSEHMNAYDLSASASWRSHLTSHQAYLANTPAARLSPWSSVPGWSSDRNFVDLLHRMWLGVAKDLSGTLLFLLGCLYMEKWSMSLPDALWYIWFEFREFMRHRGKRCDVRAFTLNTICWGGPTDFPILHSRIKAANSKAITIFLCWQTIRMIEQGCDTRPDAHHRDKLCRGFIGFVSILDASGPWLTDAEIASATRQGQTVLDMYQLLSLQACQQSLCLYKVPPKTHYVCHLILRLSSCRENPAKSDLFMAESYLGKIKMLARVCPSRTISLRVAQRLLLFLCMKWKRSVAPVC